MASRKPLKRKKNFRITITPAYLGSLRFKDYMGELNPEEVEIAKAHGLLKWNGWVKERQRRMASYA